MSGPSVPSGEDTIPASSAPQFSLSHRYAVKRVLFARGLATSYLAFDEELGDEVVIEHVRGRLHDAADWLRQYRSVAVKVMRLRHPNLIGIRDFSTDFSTEFFLVKQYDPGITLDELVQPLHADALTEGRRVGLCKGLLSGLAALHAGNVLHRDIKPSAIYVTQGQQWVAQIDHYHLAVSAPGAYPEDQLCGTPLYLAPELIAGPPRNYSRQSDVYAAGLVVLEVLSGKGMAELVELEGMTLSGGPLGLLEEVRSRGCHVRQKAVRELLPGAHGEVVCRAVRPDPEERFEDAEGFFDSFVGSC